MSHTVQSLPDHQLAPLARAYAEAVSAKRRQVLIGLVLFVGAFIVAGIVADVKPATFFTNLWRFTDYLGRIFTLEQGPYAGRFVLFDVVEWMWGFDKWLKLLWETILIAYVGTLSGAIGGFVFSFLSARNLTPNSTIGFLAKRWLEFCRTVPEIVFALIFVVAFGLGPLAGLLAIAVHTFGALGKQFAEVAENIDMKPLDGLTATGATWTERMRFAVLPQVMSNYASYALLRFEVNVRGAAVMGFVGAGGIGQDLVEAIRKFYYADVSAILVLIVLTVMLIDLGTERLRHRFIGLENRS
ncbi:phosphonate ABC transporter, permease protein PhnE [Phreatobacter oligotrophus]|jgi:phosphonate transport system permease protein|uniref:phosphonate ABC transporter, permease protein PhnE n=1 Tax=Phreatobacter oligotrophus TaxID=1122261 RepID=UPI002351FAC5|nr:phosphonate ABC transporter, permease protein PhnE [Phreatobacter oligotrophus]MBX9988957.1 phosphonate ABC transporter, permease protein PhnE [Phreatobacter oligotrophus]